MVDKIIKCGIILIILVKLSAGGDTRFECIASLGGSGLGGDGAFGGDGGFGGFGGESGEGFGMGDDAGEFEEFGEDMSEGNGIGGMMGIQTAMGSLTCPAGRRGSILVKRVSYGVNAFPGSCHPTPFCSVQHDAGESVAQTCDGKSTCSVKTLQPKMLNCGQMSNYIHVEYECVDTWATFEICETITTAARSASIILTSPGYLGTSKLTTKGTQMCECIIQSHDNADIYMDYLQTDLVSEGDSCPYEFVLLESKKNLTQSANDKEIEVCGKKHLSGQWFQGSLRITYASGGSMQKRGLLSKFTVDNLGNQPMIEMECGKVPTKNLKLQERPPQKATSAPSIFPVGMGMFPAMASMPNFGMSIPNFGIPSMGDLFNNQAPSPSSAISGNSGSSGTSEKPAPDFSKWNIKVAGDSTSANNSPKTVKVKLPSNIFKKPANKPVAPARGKANPAAKVIPTRNNPNRNRKSGGRVQTPRRRGNKGPARRPGKVVSGGDAAVEETKVKDRPNTGGNVALVVGGIGAVLIVGSVGIIALHSYRKRQRIKREEAEYAAGSVISRTYGKGWESSKLDTDCGDNSNESIYATVADVELHRMGGINPAAGPSIDDMVKIKETADVSVECKLSRSPSKETNHEDNENETYNNIASKELRRKSYEHDDRFPAKETRRLSCDIGDVEYRKKELCRKSQTAEDRVLSKGQRRKPYNATTRATKELRRRSSELGGRFTAKEQRRKSYDISELLAVKEPRRKSYAIDDHIPIKELLKTSFDTDSDEEFLKRKNKQVAVIEVHHNYVYQEEDYVDSDSTVEPDSPGPVFHESGCLDACMYATARSSENRCSECNITRPPRKRDSERCGYDNNIGVKNHCEK